MKHFVRFFIVLHFPCVISRWRKPPIISYWAKSDGIQYEGGNVVNRFSMRFCA